MVSQSQSPSPQILSAYSEKQRVQIHFQGQGRTKQSFKDECDINNIMDRFLKTGILEFTQQNQPRYGDSTGLEYQDAMLIVANAKSLFNSLPPQLRDRFENDPALFLDFVNDDKNRAEALEMGLLKPEAAAVAAEAPSPTLIPPVASKAPKAPKAAEPPAAGGEDQLLT